MTASSLTERSAPAAGDDTRQGPSLTKAMAVRCVRTIVEGQRNHGISIFAPVDHAGNPVGPGFVRKLTSNAAEVAFAIAMVSHAAEHGAPWPYPTVFQALRKGKMGEIFMEYVPSVCDRKRLRDVANAGPMADAIIASSRLIEDIATQAQLDLPDRRASGGGTEQAVLAQGLDTAVDVPQLQAMEQAFDALPTAHCHNDVGYTNMGFTDAGLRPVIRFIDFGSVGRNVLGAELHHFASFSFRTATEQALFAALVQELAERAGLERRAVRFAAYHYAMRRALQRELRLCRLAKKPVADLRHVAQLHARAASAFSKL